MYNKIRRLRINQAGGQHDEFEWEQLKENRDHKCVRCFTLETTQNPLTCDHIIPVSKGGSNNIGNIQPMCRKCNSRKSNKITDRVTCVSGGFDCLHVGHLDLFEAAADYGLIVVIVNSDDWLVAKKSYVLMPWHDRARIVSSLEIVTAVTWVNDDDGTVSEALRRIRPDYFANGGDRTEADSRESAVCEQLGIEQIFNVGGGKTRSSSALVKAASDSKEIRQSL